MRRACWILCSLQGGKGGGGLIADQLHLAAAQAFDEEGGQLRVELAAGLLLQDGDGLLQGHRRLVAAAAGHGVEGVGHAEDAGGQGNVLAADPPGVALAVVPLALPALTRAAKVQKKAAKVGFDFDSWEGAAEKVREELDETAEAARSEDVGRVGEEIGDLMFSAVNLSRLLGINAENALTNATEKFINRFEYVEAEAAARGTSLSDMSVHQMDALWNETKHSVKP